MSFVRSSKFRHVFGTAYKQEICFTDLKADGTGDTNCAVSSKFFAVIQGNKIIVCPIDEPGRQDKNAQSFIDCKSRPMDLEWSPHNDYMLLSGNEGGDVDAWLIPPGGLKKRMTEAYWEMHGSHHRKVTFVQWHPVAENIAASGGFDNFIIIWNVENAEEVFRISVGQQPTNFDWGINGKRVAITTKEGNNAISLSIVNPHNGEVLSKNPECNNSSKPTKVKVLANGNVLTVAADKGAQRKIRMWDGNDVTRLICEVDADNSSTVLNIYYDPDLEIFYTFGKGESVIKYYEISGEEIHFLSAYSSNVSQKGGNFLPKRAVNYIHCEIARFYKLCPNKVEPTIFTVPRKSEQFQDDIFPITCSGEAGLKADDWVAGMDSDPPKKDIRELEIAGTGKELAAPKKTSSSSAPKAAPKPASYGHSNGTAQNNDYADLLEDVKKLKSTVKKLSKRISKLEETVSLENGGEEEEEEEEE